MLIGYVSDERYVALADVALDSNGRPIPTHFREEFRTRGPSNYRTHGKQAEG